jgi:nucleotide-binding universal stress UspA family protein
MIEEILWLHSPDNKAERTVRFGNPAKEIASESGSLGADLIVLGSRDRNWLEGLFDTSVSRGVAQRADRTSLILPPQGSDQASS